MPPHVLELLRVHGVVRRRVLIKAGLTHKRLARALRRGELRLLTPDVVALPGLPTVGEALAAAAAALDGTVCGASAALRWGWALVEAPSRHEVCVPRDRGGRHLEGVRIRRRDLLPSEVEDRDGTSVTTPRRTAMDCARDLPLREAVVAVDSALRSRAVRLADLRRDLAAMPAGPGRGRVARVLALVDARSGSVLESVFRVLLTEAGMTPEEVQLIVRHLGRWIGRVDFAWPSARLVVECDGFAFHSDREAYRKDRRWGNALVLAGWRVLRFSWEDVVGSPDEVVRTVREALDAGGCWSCAAGGQATVHTA